MHFGKGYGNRSTAFAKVFFTSHISLITTEPSAKVERRLSEGKSASWRSRVCEARAARTEGKSVSWRSQVCEARAAHTNSKSLPITFLSNKINY
ncbi:hypothetical protein HMPREF9075_01128 [Capnocytophaga sp. oral taxon 332 str. F0381]|uniref:hypothetical protein n=1 Tax=Capnocytophaga sp. oral taxon 332 TaxID=712213 RepID=UPI0002A2872B|nr:hypothetical protein [Capnocytophaga sp. oral taxon 332]EKY10343.1 hypothetical protein HMPREF9075_01128 [Capnocytophaga sp. oral taxon 332 str. F0381]